MTPSRPRLLLLTILVAGLALASCARSGAPAATVPQPPAPTAAAPTTTTKPAAEPVATSSSTPPTAAPAPVVAGVTRDIEFEAVGGQRLRLDAYVPESAGQLRAAVVIVHGGGWRSGDKGDWSGEAQKLMDAGFVAFSVNYRLAPAFRFPAQLEDVQAAVRWVRSHAAELGVDPARIGALGGSAGGHLAGLLGTTGSGPLDRDARVKAVVSWSGPMNFHADINPERGQSSTAVPELLGCSRDACPDLWSQASPIDQVDSSDAPMLLANSKEELVPEAQARAMSARLDQAGVANRLVIFPGSQHARAYSQKVWADTVAWFQQHL